MSPAPSSVETGVAEVSAIDAGHFRHVILPAARPVVFRGLAAHWPAVGAARESDEALFAYLSRFDRGEPITTLIGDPQAGGRFFYNDDLTGFNFHSGAARLDKSFEFLLANRETPGAATLAAQSIAAETHLPGFAADNPCPLLDASIHPRLWLGNRAIVAAHQDPYENLAVVVAGRRRFTLFPPESVGDLYVGPLEKTPGGPAISLVSLDAPDLESHPRFEKALEQALVVELEPGDALYIPYLWWHHVRSLAPVNLLTNYWWAAAPKGRGEAFDAFLHAVLALRGLPDSHRAGWKAAFDHYVFGDPEAATDHLPAARHGMLGKLTEADAVTLRRKLAQKLMSD